MCRSTLDRNNMLLVQLEVKDTALVPTISNTDRGQLTPLTSRLHRHCMDSSPLDSAFHPPWNGKTSTSVRAAE